VAIKITTLKYKQLRLFPGKHVLPNAALQDLRHHGQMAPNKLPIDRSTFFPVGSTGNIFREQKKDHLDHRCGFRT